MLQRLGVVMLMNPRLIKLMMAASKRQSGLAVVAGRRAEALVTNFGGWYSGADSVGLAQQLGTLAEGTARTAAFYADVADGMFITEMSGVVAARGPKLFDGLARYGVTGFEVYDRIPAHYRYAMSRGLSEQLAMASTVDRVKRMLELDGSLAAREQHRST